jgi:CcmD family protein
MNPYLCAAYVATWTIHIAYLGTLARRYARLRREIKDLEPKA